MNIPRYWAKAEQELGGPAGNVFLRCWGWSVKGMDEARDRAGEALARLMDRVRQGAPFPQKYLYGTRALREEIIREIPGESGEQAGVITRNSYGSLVLNTQRVMFIDVDMPQGAAPKSSGGWFKRKPEPSPADAALDDLRKRLSNMPGRYRIYKTAAGFRLLGLDRCYDPDSAEAEQKMRALNADPNFVQLCRAQKSFRARLTPKPWRCQFRVPPSQYPRQTSAETASFEDWLSGYDNASRGFATCALLEDAGSGGVHDEVSTVLSWHDEFTKATSGLPLA